MQPTIRIGIIGVGQIGKKHLETYQRLPDVKVIAIAGRDPGRTAHVARDYSIGHCYTDFRQLLAREDIDAVDICLHNNLHLPAAVVAFQAGKHVFCEKPIAGSYADGTAMLAASRQYDRMLSIQLADLFSVETKAALEAVRQGWLGKPYYACSAGFRRRGRPYVDGYGGPDFVRKETAAGGALLDVGIYHIANILYLLDNPPALRVTGQTYQETAVDPERLRSSGYNVEEFAAGFVCLEGGITLQIVEAWAAHLDTFGGSYILGAQGGLRLNPFGVFRSLGDLDLNGSVDLEAFDYRTHSLRAAGTAYDGPQQHWIAALQGRVPLLPTAEIALNTMLISEGIYLSGQEGREVSRQEISDRSQSSAVEM